MHDARVVKDGTAESSTASTSTATAFGGAIATLSAVGRVVRKGAPCGSEGTRTVYGSSESRPFTSIGNRAHVSLNETRSKDDAFDLNGCVAVYMKDPVRK